MQIGTLATIKEVWVPLKAWGAIATIFRTVSGIVTITTFASKASSSTPHQATAVTSEFMSGIFHTSSPHFIPKHSVFSVQPPYKPFLFQNEWIVDTGATDHMVYSLSSFTSITSTIHGYIHLPNGQKVLATHIGSVQISNTLILTNVLCVPAFSFNLITITKFTDSMPCCVLFFSQFCFI